MPSATMQTVEALTKELYETDTESSLNEEVTGYKRIERTSDGVTNRVGGKYVDFPIKVKRNSGIGYRNENEQLQDPDRTGWAEVHTGLKYGYGRARLTGQVMELAEKDHQVFASAMDEEMEDLKNGLTRDCGRIFYGDGTGLMASVTADGANTVTVDNAQYLEVGMKIDILVRATGAVLAQNRVITAIDGDTRVVTYDGADVLADATHGLYRTGNYNREPSGLGNIVSDTTTLFGLDPTVESKWKAVIDNPGAERALSEGLMINFCDKIRRSSGKKTSVIFTSLGVRTAYFNLLTQQRRYTDTKKFDGGLQGLAFHYGTEIPVVEDLDAPPKKMWFLNESSFKIYRSQPWHWADRDGSIWKWVVNFDAWDALMQQYWELGIKQRNSQGMMGNIIEG